MTDSVLVYVPTYKDTACAETLRAVSELQFDGKLTVEIADGAALFDTASKEENLFAQQRRAWDMALDGGYSALAFVEHDMQPPATAIQAAWNLGKSVVYCPYMFRHGLYKISIFRREGGINIGMSLSNYPRELRAAREAGRWRCSGTGWGCTLVRRDVLRAVELRTDDNPYTDLPFAADCERLGIEQWAAMDQACLHYDPMTRVWLNPWWDGGGVKVKVKALKNVVLGTTDGPLHMEAGQEYQVDRTAAFGAQRAGYAQILDAENKTVAKRTSPTKRRVTKKAKQ